MKTKPIIRIAYADNHTMVREGITKLLHAATGTVKFHVVLSAENGPDLVTKLESTSTLPDVCLLDLHMPQKDAWDTLPLLRQRWPNMNVLIFTMQQDEYKANLLMTCGAKGYLMKSANSLMLMNAIEVIYKGGTYCDERLQKGNIVTIKSDKKAITIALTPMEIEIVRLLHQHPEMGWKEMTVPLKITYKTLDRIKQRIYDKLNVHNRSELLKYVIEHGMV